MNEFIESVKSLEYKKEAYFFAAISFISGFFYFLNNSHLQFLLISIWAFSSLIIFIKEETSLLFYKFKSELKNPKFNRNDIEKRKTLKRDIVRTPLILFLAILVISPSFMGLFTLSELITSVFYFSILTFIYYNLGKISINSTFA